MNMLFVFLGNPGREYRLTRHNFGWMICDAIDKVSGSPVWKRKFNSSYTLLPRSSHRKIFLLRPETGMNKSGYPVSAAAAYFNIPMEQIIVVHDELEVPFGSAAFKFGGGAGGHNGLRSIVSQLGSGTCFRFRLGTGRPARGSAASFLLSRFTPDEEAFLPDIMENAAARLLELTEMYNPDQLKGIAANKTFSLSHSESPAGDT